jgi:hypothetical protein
MWKTFEATQNRDTIRTIAMSVAGISADLPVYSELISPGESARMTADMAKMSGYALVCSGILIKAGLLEVLPDELKKWFNPPYPIGCAVTRMVLLGKHFKALKTKDIKPGDMVLVNGPEHMFVQLDDGFVIEGGQVDEKGRQYIAYRKKRERRKLIYAWDMDKIPLGSHGQVWIPKGDF